MNDVIAVMLDVSQLITRGSDAARQEAGRIDVERERRAAADQAAERPPVQSRWWYRIACAPR